MTTNETRTESEVIKENIELQKEVKKLHEMLDGLAKTQVKILQNAIRGDKETVVSNEETIGHGKKMAELNNIVEKSAKEIESHIENVVSNTRTVSESALSVVAAAEKTNEQIMKLIQSRTNILNAISKKYNIKID